MFKIFATVAMLAALPAAQAAPVGLRDAGAGAGTPVALAAAEAQAEPRLRRHKGKKGTGSAAPAPAQQTSSGKGKGKGKGGKGKGKGGSPAPVLGCMDGCTCQECAPEDKSTTFLGGECANALIGEELASKFSGMWSMAVMCEGVVVWTKDLWLECTLWDADRENCFACQQPVSPNQKFEGADKCLYAEDSRR